MPIPIKRKKHALSFKTIYKILPESAESIFGSEKSIFRSQLFILRKWNLQPDKTMRANPYQKSRYFDKCLVPKKKPKKSPK